MLSQLVTGPASEPVTLAEAKAHLRLETTADDSYVSALITAARQHIEEVCWRGLITQTWDGYTNRFPASADGLVTGASTGVAIGLIAPPAYGQWPEYDPHRQTSLELPKGQLQSVTSVKYVDDAGVLQTLASTEYAVNSMALPGRLMLPYGKNWPSTRFQYDAVQVRYVVGWADAASVPSPIKQALLLLVSQMYEHRTPEVFGILAKVEFAVDALLSPYRLNRYA